MNFPSSMCHGHLAGWLGAVALLLLPGVAPAQGDMGSDLLPRGVSPVRNEIVRLFASEGGEGDRFGDSVAVDGSLMVIGARFDGQMGTDSGSVYGFGQVAGNWSRLARLNAPDGTTGDEFGGAVAVSGTTVAVGAVFDDDLGTDSGSVYLYQWTGGGFSAPIKITASDGVEDDFFGVSVALQDDLLVVGAPGDDDGASRSGSVYVFRRDTTGWEELDKFGASDPGQGDIFGFSVAIDGDLIAVGAYEDDDGADGAGSAYVFRRSGDQWNQEDKLVSNAPTMDARLGLSLDVSGNTVAVGAPFEDAVGVDSGSVYLFRGGPGGWSQLTRLTPSDGGADDEFGHSVALSGTRLVVGARVRDSVAEDAGSAYVFQENGSWVEIERLLASDGGSFNYLGAAVAFSGETTVVGAWGDDNQGEDSGSAYVFGPAPAALFTDGFEDLPVR